MTESLLFVLADRPSYAIDWARDQDIPRSRIRPITSEPDIKRLRGLNSVTYVVHESWADAPLDVTHEVQHRFSWVRGVGGTVTRATTPEDLDPYRARPRPAPVETPMSEDDFKDQVIKEAKDRGWLVVHFRPARTAKGYRTAIQGDKGYPDLTLARDGRVLFAELKSETGRASVEQKQWLHHLGTRAYLWRPSDWPTIREMLA